MKKTSIPVRILQYVILVLAVVFALYPIWFGFLASLRASQSLYTFNVAGMFLPIQATLDNFKVMLFDKPYLTWLWNSLKVAGLTTIFCLLVTTSAAFTLSRFKFKGRNFFLILLLALSTFPGLLSLTAVAQLLAAFKLYNTHLGLILAYTAGTLVFCTYNLKGYFDSLPIDLEEAARIDGCGPVQAFTLVALPLVRPALAVTALLGFLSGWGDFIFASVLIPANNQLKLAVPALYELANNISVPWGEFAAGAIVVILPTLLVFLFVQRYFEAGLTGGGVKG